ncbi:MAG: pseudouridine synthase [Actinomycetota bacterium]
MAENVRLQKFMADCGVASRRACEEVITAGGLKVIVRKVTSKGVKIDPINTQVEVDGQIITQHKTKTYIAFHKPRGVLSTMSDPEGRPNLGDYFGGFSERLFHAGRLDKESEGLIILTNDGAWSHEATHPSFGVEKTYLVETAEILPKATFQKLLNGVELEDGLAKPISARQIAGRVELVIHEGRNQIVRRIFDALGHPVERLMRVAIGSIKLGELPVGKWRNLNEVETRSL